MKTIDLVRKRLIDQIMVTENVDLLNAIDSIFQSVKKNENISLDPTQIEMLIMSENDIENGNFVSESELNKQDSSWMD